MDRQLGMLAWSSEESRGHRLDLESLPVRTALEAVEMPEKTKGEEAERRALRIKLRRHEHSYGLGKRPVKERQE